MSRLEKYFFLIYHIVKKHLSAAKDFLTENYIAK